MIAFTLIFCNLEKFHSEFVDSIWFLSAIYTLSLDHCMPSAEVGIYNLILSEHIS